MFRKLVLAVINKRSNIKTTIMVSDDWRKLVWACEKEVRQKRD